jgi:hypothetical protein
LDYNNPEIKRFITMPEKIVHNISIIHDGNEKKLHSVILRMLNETIDDFVSGLTQYHSVLTAFLRLRQAAIAGYIINPLAKRKGDQEELANTKKIVAQLKRKN